MTTKTDVLKLLQDQKQQARMDISHPDEMRKEWLESLESLMTQFEGWLKTAEDQRLVQVERVNVTLNEKIFHQYDAPALMLTLPRGDIVQIQPKGLFIVGGKGRVDFVRSPKQKRLIRTDKGDWEFVEPNPVGGWKHQPLDESTFWEAIGHLAT